MECLGVKGQSSSRQQQRGWAGGGSSGRNSWQAAVSEEGGVQLVHAAGGRGKKSTLQPLRTAGGKGEISA